MDMMCPFCEVAEFDEIGLCLHLASDCRSYDRACRRTSDEMDRRASAVLGRRPADVEADRNG